MEWVKDLQEQGNENSKKIDQLIAELGKKKVQDATAVAEINRAAQSLRGAASSCESATNHLKRLKNEFPESLPPSVKVHKIDNVTLGALSFMLLGFIIGHIFSPIAVNTYDIKRLEYQLERRENQIQKFQKVHPKFTKQYFGD